MKSKDQFKNKLLIVSEKVVRAQEDYNKAFTLIKSFFTSESIDNELNRLFALKNFELEELKKILETYKIQYKIIADFTEIITDKEDSLEKALRLLDRHNDNLSNLIADLKSIYLFLGKKLNPGQ